MQKDNSDDYDGFIDPVDTPEVLSEATSASLNKPHGRES